MHTSPDASRQEQGRELGAADIENEVVRIHLKVVKHVETLYVTDIFQREDQPLGSVPRRHVEGAETHNEPETEQLPCRKRSAPRD